MFDEIVIDLWFSWNFTCIKNIIKTCNLTVRFSKFTLNIEIYKKFVEFLFKLVGKKTLFFTALQNLKEKRKKRKEKKRKKGTEYTSRF